MSKLRNFVITIIIILLVGINIYLISLYAASRKNNDLNTVAELERVLCSCRNMKRKKEWKEQQCPPHGFVTSKPGSELGTKMWQYISIWGVARRAGLEAYSPRCLRSELDNIFSSLTIPTLDDISHCMVNASGFVKSLQEWNYKHQGVMIETNAFMAEIALIWVEDVRKEFTIRKDLVRRSQNILRTFVNNGTDKVFVGVDVRRKNVNVSFYYSAMKYYEDKYQNVAFIMTSDVSKWCIEEFSNKSNVFVVDKQFKSNDYLDLAILAACNHSIFDYGTFGGMSAILAGGEAIFYKIKGDLTERLSKLLPNWQAIR